MHCWKQTSYLSWTYYVLVLVPLHCITLLDHGSLSCHKMWWPSKYYQTGFCVRSKQYMCLLSRGIYGRRSCRQWLWKRLNTCHMHGSWHRLAPSLLSLFSKPGGPWRVTLWNITRCHWGSRESGWLIFKLCCTGWHVFERGQGDEKSATMTTRGSVWRQL